MKSAIVATMLCVLATPLAAQQAVPARGLPPELREGRWGVSFGVFSGGGSLGLFRMTSVRNALTLDVRAHGHVALTESEDATRVVDQEQANFRVSIEPGFRRYGAGRGEVASFFAANAVLGVEGHVYETETVGYYRSSQTYAPFGGVGAGLGVEWFATDALSLRAQVGGVVEYSYRYSETTDSPVEQRREHIIRGNIGGAGLSGSIWF